VAYYVPHEEGELRKIINHGKFCVSNKFEDEDENNQFHFRNKVGKGVVCYPNFKTAELDYPVIINLNNNKEYKIIIMVRVRPDSIRCYFRFDEERWVVNNNDNEIRPYRILIKEENNE